MPQRQEFLWEGKLGSILAPSSDGVVGPETSLRAWPPEWHWAWHRRWGAGAGGGWALAAVGSAAPGRWVQRLPSTQWTQHTFKHDPFFCREKASSYSFLTYSSLGWFSQSVLSFRPSHSPPASLLLELLLSVFPWLSSLFGATTSLLVQSLLRAPIIFIFKMMTTVKLLKTIKSG